jgi:tRNA (cytidine/uridine-2'-O-)-methyltransferase
MKLCGIIFYHPKNPQNVADLASLAAHKRSPLIVVPRPGGEHIAVAETPRHHIIQAASLREATEKLPGNTLYLVLETYGKRYITDISFENEDCIALVLGAEDYGIPPSMLDSLPRHLVAKIPVAVQGMSYNVVVSAAIALYELERKAKAGTHGTGGAE